MIKFFSVLIITVIFIAIRFISKRKKNRLQYNIPARVKNAYKKITIPVSQITILSRSYYEEETETFSRIDMLDTIIKKHPRLGEEKNVSVLIYDGVIVRGKKIKLKSIPIYLPEASLKNRLNMKKTIDVYFDEKKPERVYFDLAFFITSYL